MVRSFDAQAQFGNLDPDVIDLANRQEPYVRRDYLVVANSAEKLTLPRRFALLMRSRIDAPVIRTPSFAIRGTIQSRILQSALGNPNAHQLTIEQDSRLQAIVDAGAYPSKGEALEAALFAVERAAAPKFEGSLADLE